MGALAVHPLAKALLAGASARLAARRGGQRGALVPGGLPRRRRGLKREVRRLNWQRRGVLAPQD